MDYKILTLKKDESEKKLRELGKLIFDGTKPPPGPYGFFHHNAHSFERLQDCHRIIKRLFIGREKLTKLANLQKKIMPSNLSRGVPFPKRVQKIIELENELNLYMNLIILVIFKIETIEKKLHQFMEKLEAQHQPSKLLQ